MSDARAADGLPGTPRSRRMAALCAFGAALLVYLPTYLPFLGYGFVNYDDPIVLSAANPAIGKGLIAGLPDLLLEFRAEEPFNHAWLPLYHWSHGLDHAVFGDAAWGHHLHSTLLHGLCAALVVMIALRLRMAVLPAAFAGVLFATHPVATESVAWVASRKDALSFAWMAAAALLYLDAIRRRRPDLHAFGALCLAVSLTAKGTTLVLPFLLLVHAWLLRDDEEPLGRRLRAVIPYGAVALVLTSVHFWVALRAKTAAGGGGLLDVLVADLGVVWHYFAALVAPFHLSVEHGLVATGSLDWTIGAGALVLVGWGAALVLTRHRNDVAFAALLAVPLALAPFNNVLPRTSVLFAERYCYVALLPLVLGVAALLRPRALWEPRRPALLVVALAVALTALRLPVWRDSVSLWEDAAQKAPKSALVRMQLADAYQQRALFGDPESSRENAVAAARNWADARRLARTGVDKIRANTGCGSFLLATIGSGPEPSRALTEAVGMFSVALNELEVLGEAPGAKGKRAEVLAQRGTALELLGRRAEALADWEAAARLDTRNATSQTALARLYLQAGRMDDVRKCLDASREIAPDDPLAVRDRTRVYVAMGDLPGAKRDLVGALEAHPDDADLLLEAARVDALLMRPVDAEKKLRKALEARPGDPQLETALASALMDQALAYASRDDVDGARAAAAKAAEFAPESSAPEQVLGVVARRAGDLDEALRRFRRARDLKPDGVRIRESLASVLVERGMQLVSPAGGGSGDGAALLLLEEAIAIDTEFLTTSHARLRTPGLGWPEPDPDDERAQLVRTSALKGLGRLALGEPKEALEELQIAEVGSRDGDPRMRLVVLDLLVRTLFQLDEQDLAARTAEEFPDLVASIDGAPRYEGTLRLAGAVIERGVSLRTRKRKEDGEVELTRAKALLERARDEGMPESRLHLKLGEIAFAEEDFLEATRRFDRATELDPNDVEPYLDRAEMWRTHFLLQEDTSFLRGAREELMRALAVAHSDPRVLALLGEVFFLDQRPSEAFPWLQRAVLADPSRKRARQLLSQLIMRAGENYLEKRELDQALAAAQRAVAFDPPGPEAEIFLARVLREQEEWARALEHLEAARKRFPQDVRTADALASFYSAAGHMQLLSGKKGEAVEALLRSLDYPDASFDTNPARARLNSIAGAAYKEGRKHFDAGEFEEAARQFRLSTRAEPNAEGFVALGAALDSAGEPEEAVVAFGECLARDDGHLRARLYRAAAYQRLGRLDAAEEDYRAWQDRADADDPERRRVESQIAWIVKTRAEIDAEIERERRGDPPREE